MPVEVSLYAVLLIFCFDCSILIKNCFGYKIVGILLNVDIEKKRIWLSVLHIS